MPPVIRTVVEADPYHRADDAYDEKPPLGQQKVADRHQDTGDERQFAAELRQDTGKLRDDTGKQKEGDGERDDEHDRRIGHGAFKFAAERRLLFLIVGDAFQNAV